MTDLIRAKTGLKIRKIDKFREVDIGEENIDHNRRLSDQAYSFIKRMILKSHLKIEEPLSEAKLAKTIGISRTPVREALNKLVTENILISYDNRGYFVNLPSFKVIKEMYEVRMILEGGAAKLAAANVDVKYLSRYRAQFLSFCKKPDLEDGEREVVELGRSFHFFILDSACNDRLTKAVKSIYDHLEISRILLAKSYRGAVEEHMKILCALEERNGEKSREYMEEHIRNAFRKLAEII